MGCKVTAERIRKLAKEIRAGRPKAKCLIGFDGYVDELYSVVQKRNSQEDFAAFGTIGEFGKRIMDAAGKSADIEIVPQRISIGGNAPLLAGALAELHYDTVCIGQMDVENGSNPFNEMNPSCRRVSIGRASRTIALEFRDGKIMLGNLLGSYTGWEEIREKAGKNNLMYMAEESRLIGIVNWSGMYRMNKILKGLYEEILILLIEKGMEKDLFLDLADPSARSGEDLEELFRLVREISAVHRITMGMNENEAAQIGKKFCGEDAALEEAGEAMRAGLGLYQLVIHTNRMAYGFREGEVRMFSGMHVEHPIQTTGAGDHFNAGFCLGMLEGRSLQESLVLGQAMASFYVGTGKTADREGLVDYLGKGEDYGEKFLS